MGGLWMLDEAQMRRIEPFFSLSHGIPRVDDRRVVSGIIYVIKHGLMWRDAPKAYGPHKTIYNRFIRWSRLGLLHHQGWRPDYEPTSSALPSSLCSTAAMLPRIQNRPVQLTDLARLS